MKAAVNDLSLPGFLVDQPDLIAPAGAWTDSRNVRYRDGAAEKFRGYAQALGNLSATAIWANPISDGNNYFWVYAGNSVIYGTDGTTHTNVGHPSLSYNAADDLGWTGGPFHGYMLANDGVNIPTFWSPSLSNKFSSLSAWPAITCKVLRPFKDFIFAFRITDTGTYFPRVIRWSDKAAQSAIPASWDYTDPTNQAGITELGQTEDLLVDALALRDNLIIYKESNTWAAEYVGGGDVFGFRQLFSQSGMLTENCGAAINTNHLVLTGDDIVLHDGNSAQSIADKRVRRWLFNRINSNRYKRSFVVADYRNREAYICFPESGYDWPNLALVWNWAENTFSPFELGGTKSWITPGVVPGGQISFDSDTPGSFDAGAGVFDEETYSPFQKRLMLFAASAARAYQNDTGETYDGTQMSCYGERTATPITEDLGSVHSVWRIWPRVMGTIGDIFTFWVGARDTLSSAVSYSGPYTFTLGTDAWIDCRLAGRVIDLRVEYSGSNTFRLHGMSVEFDRQGTR